MRLRFLSHLLFALAAPAFAADVIEVPNPAAGIQSAVDAAQPGDVVLIAAGTYEEGVFVVGKGVSLVADGPVFLRRLEITDVPAGQTMLVDGFTVSTAGTVVTGFEVPLVVEDCAGSVRVQDCNLCGTPGFAGLVFGPMPYDGFPAAQFVRCDDVAVVGSSAEGGFGDTLFDEDIDGTATSGASAIEVEDSFVVIDGCELIGGFGGDILDTVTDPGGTGGSGVDVSGFGKTIVVGCTIVGGDGGNADCDFIGCGFGGGGGHGVLLTDGGSAALRDVDFTPGIGGLDGDFSTKADDGQIAAEFGGSARFLDAAARGFDATTPVREGGAVTLSFTGEGGDLVALYTAFDGSWTPLGAGGQGVFLLGAPLLFGDLFVGAIPAGGTLIVPLAVPDLGPGVEGLDVHAQALFGAGRQMLVGSARAITLLDAAF